MTIYLDVYFFLNTIMNIIALYLSSKLLQMNVSFFRLAAGALLGGVLSTSVLVFFSANEVDLFASVIILLIMSGVAFGENNLRSFFRNSFFTVMISAQISGILEIFSNYLGYGGEPSLAFLIITLTVPMFSLTVFVFIRHLRRKLDLIFCDTVIRLKDGGEFKLKSLYDSGNLLKDPYNGSSVILMSGKAFSAISGVDPKEYTYFSDLKGISENKELLPVLLPISRCGGKTELIFGFRPKYVLLKRGGIIKHDIFTRNITVGIMADISDFSGCECLLPAGII